MVTSSANWPELPALNVMQKFIRTCIVTLVGGFLPSGPMSLAATSEPVRIVAFGDSTTAPRLDLILYGTLLE
jgi:hypothetical protein